MSGNNRVVAMGVTPCAGRLDVGVRELDRVVAREWVRRWDAQQERYIADREERFRVIGDVVERVCAENPSPVVVDLGCGPGSLAARLGARLPGARIVGLDLHPFLLSLAHATRPRGAGVEYRRVELGAPGWRDALDGVGEWDAAVSTTALHWVEASRLADVYAELAMLIRPGGVLVNGDHLYDDQPAVRELAAYVREERARRVGVTDNEEWSAWWDAVRADPVLSGAFQSDELTSGGVGHGNGLSPQRHAAMLRDAGFREVGVVWQGGDDVVQVAVR
jgi:SAM-dependent methyltransferase